MKGLKELLPAQTFFILQKGNVKHKDFLRYTFMDLILKRVLKIVEIEKQASNKDPVRKQTYVDVGDNYKTYTPTDFEKPFINSFKFDDGMRVLLRNYIIVCKTNTRNFKSQLAAPFLGQYITHTLAKSLPAPQNHF
jgi:hypothetical protein